MKKAIRVISMFLAAVTLAGLVQVAAQASAGQGWPSAVTMRNTATAWDQALVEWTGFSGTQGYEDSYTAQRSRGSAMIEWTVTVVGEYVNGEPVTLPVRANLLAVAPTDRLQVFRHSVAGGEQLHIQQNRNNRWYGSLRVELNVTALRTDNAQELSQSGVLRVALVSVAALNQAIAAAERLLENRARYSAEYIAELERLVEVAKFYLGSDISYSAEALESIRVSLQSWINAAPEHHIRIFSTRWPATQLYWILFFFAFGFIWMWF
jgi:hypothetical protein